MSEKQGRKADEMSVNGPAFRAVLEQARKRQAVTMGLRAIIDEAGPDLRDMVLRPGEIERMKGDLRAYLLAEGEPGVDEQVEEFGAMLVEIRRRVEEGVLRFSRKKPPQVTADKSEEKADADAAGDGEGTTSNEERADRRPDDSRNIENGSSGSPENEQLANGDEAGSVHDEKEPPDLNAEGADQYNAETSAGSRSGGFENAQPAPQDDVSKPTDRRDGRDTSDPEQPTAGQGENEPASETKQPEGEDTAGGGGDSGDGPPEDARTGLQAGDRRDLVRREGQGDDD